MPSVNSNSVTALDPSGEVPDTMVPLEPTAADCGVPPETALPGAAIEPSRAVLAAVASGSTRIVSPICRLPSWLVNAVKISPSYTPIMLAGIDRTTR